MNIFKKLIFSLSIIHAPALFAQNNEPHVFDINILFLATSEVVSEQSITKVRNEIDNALNRANVTLENSNVNMRLHKGGFRRVAIDESRFLTARDMSSALVNLNDGVLDDVYHWQRQARSSIVVLITQGKGSAAANADVPLPYDPEGIDADIDVGKMKHAIAMMNFDKLRSEHFLENAIGKIVGLTEENGHLSTESVIRNDRLQPAWGTIMTPGVDSPRINYFSDPNLTNPETGEALGVEGETSAVEILNDRVVDVFLWGFHLPPFVLIEGTNTFNWVMDDTAGQTIVGSEMSTLFGNTPVTYSYELSLDDRLVGFHYHTPFSSNPNYSLPLIVWQQIFVVDFKSVDIRRTVRFGTGDAAKFMTSEWFTMCQDYWFVGPDACNK